MFWEYHHLRKHPYTEIIHHIDQGQQASDLDFLKCASLNIQQCGFAKITSLGIQLYSQMMIRVSNHLLSIVFRFHYHSQEVIGSLGLETTPKNWRNPISPRDTVPIIFLRVDVLM